MDLERLERDGWDALCEGGATARDFYDRVLDEGARMLLPGGLVLTDRDLMLQTMGDEPWDSYELSELVADQPTPDTGLVTYAVEARRGDTTYRALLSSLYAQRDGEWRMVFHQQTPR